MHNSIVFRRERIRIGTQRQLAAVGCQMVKQQQLHSTRVVMWSIFVKYICADEPRRGCGVEGEHLAGRVLQRRRPSAKKGGYLDVAKRDFPGLAGRTSDGTTLS